MYGQTMTLLRRAGMFAQPEAEGEGKDKKEEKKPDEKKPDDKKADDKSGGDKKEEGAESEDGKPIPYARFKEVNDAKRAAERDLKTARADVTRLTAEVEQLKSSDQSGTLKTVQAEVARLIKQIETIDTEFEDMLEIALADLPKEKAAIVRDIPGGARAQFAWFNKHRGALNGETKDEKKGIEGSKHDKKPDGDKKTGASSSAKAYVEGAKPKPGGWGSVTGK